MNPPMGPRLLYWLPIVAALATLGLLVSELPLGRLGEWVWNRSPRPPGPERWLLPVLVGGLYVLFVPWGRARISRDGGVALVWLFPMLFFAAVVLHASWFQFPVAGLGVERWAPSLFFPATSGYFTVARTIRDGGAFLADYETWISAQDNFHIGTHPPGLILLNFGVLRLFADQPEWANTFVGLFPERFMDGLTQASGARGIPIVEQATLGAIALLTWVAYLLTLFPIYGLARFGASRENAWLASAAWPLVPAGVLFLPASDCLFPLVSTILAWLMLRAPLSRVSVLEFLAGLLFVSGMFFSLAFLAVLPIAVGGRLLHGWSVEGMRWRSLWGVASFAVGMVLAMLACQWLLDLNLLATWRTNLGKHAGFYERMPRSYLPWIGLNLVEFAISSGPVIFVAALLAFCRCSWIKFPSTRLGALQCCWLATLVALDLSGRNLSEAGRLWIFLTPFACTGLAWTVETWRPRGWREHLGLGLWLLVEVVVSLALVAAVEPLLPVHGS